MSTADFNLSLTKTGVKSIRVRWSRNSALDTRVQIFRPGDGSIIHTKTYSSSVNSDDFTYEVPFFGEYKVRIAHGGHGSYLWEEKKIMVALSTTVAMTHTYTTADVDRWRAEQLAIAFVFGTLGLSSRTAIRFSLAAFSAWATVSNIWNHDTEREGMPAPRAGHQFRHTISSINGGVKHTYEVFDTNGSRTFSHSTNQYYLTYDF